MCIFSISGHRLSRCGPIYRDRYQFSLRYPYRTWSRRSRYYAYSPMCYGVDSCYKRGYSSYCYCDPCSTGCGYGGGCGYSPYGYGHGYGGYGGCC